MRNILVGFLNLILAVIAFFLGLRFVFRLLGANPNTPFVSWIYDISNNLMAPFRGIFPNPVINNNSVFDIAALVALVAYTVLIYLAIAIINMVIASVGGIGHPHTDTHAHSH